LSLPLTTRFGADPVLDLELANKQYVDNASGGSLGKALGQDFTVNNSTTLVNVPNFSVAVEASSFYYFRLSMRSTSGTTPDVKLGFTIPSGATGGYTWLLASPNTADRLWGTPAALAGTGAIALSNIAGLLITDTTAGTFQIQWAQNTANASDTTMLTGTTFVMIKQDGAVP